MADLPPTEVARRRTAVERMFSAIAPRYDLLNHLLSAGRDHAWRRAAVRLAALPPSARILDLCTGTADLALEAARQLGQASIIGVDVSLPMLRLAALKAEQAAMARRLRLAAAPAEVLPFADARFDAVMVAFGLRNVVDRQRGLAEMHRVLRPGGRAVILEFTTPPGRLFRAVYLWYFHRVLPLIGGLISGEPSAYAYLPASVAEFPDPHLLSGWMGEAGFRNVSYRLLTAGIVAIHVGTK